MAQHWERDERTGDYVMQDGAPKQTDSLRIPAYNRLKIRRTQWMYAPNKSDYGSDFYRLKKRQTNRDTSTVENITARGLQPLLDDGRAQRIDIDFDAVARHGVGLKVDIISAQGTSEQLKLNPLGA